MQEELNHKEVKLNSMQSDAFWAIFDDDLKMRDDSPEEVAIFGGYRNGKSWIVMWITFLMCFTYPGTKWIFCRATSNHLRDTAFLQFKESFTFEGVTTIKDQAMEIHFTNGSTIVFRAFDGNRISRIQSSEFDGASICQAEEVQHDLFLKIFGRLSGNHTPKRLMLLEGNPDDTWPKARYKDSELPQGCLFLEASTHVNVENVGNDYIERLMREYPPEFLDRYVFSSWDTVSNQVYTSFNQSMHVINPIKVPNHWHKVIGFDHGSVNPSAMVWLAVDEKGRLYAYDEWYMKAASIQDMKEAAFRHGPMPIIADYSMKSNKKYDEHGDLWHDLKREGLNLVECKKDNKANILIVNQMFHQNKMFFFNTLTTTIKEHAGYRWVRPKLGQTTDHKEEVIKKDDHTVDAVQYPARYLKDIQVIKPTEVPYEKTLEYHVQHVSSSYENQVLEEG